jgi:hypothetical protein
MLPRRNPHLADGKKSRVEFFTNPMHGMRIQMDEPVPRLRSAANQTKPQATR